MRENQNWKEVEGIQTSGVFMFLVFVFFHVDEVVFKSWLEDISEMLGDCDLGLGIMQF